MFDVTKLKGWVPADAVVSQGRPGLLWMDARGTTFPEPFFQQTVERLRNQEPKPVEQFTDFDAALSLEKISESLKPTGFIFHSSRCGSTLIANALKCLEDSIVVSEASAIDKLAARFITDPGKETVYSVILRAVVSSYGQKRTGQEHRFFVKWSCCSTSQLKRIQRIWPDVPWVFVYRDPVETVVSNLVTKPDWLLDPDRRVLASIIDVPVETVSRISDEELCVRTVASFYRIAQQLANDKCLLLNYSDLSLSTVLRLLSFFRIDPSHEEIEAIIKISQVYSKDASQSRSFVDDIELKRELASNLVDEQVQTWAINAYRQLDEARVDSGKLN